MQEQRDLIDAVLKAVIDQVPMMAVKAITLAPRNPQNGQDVVARIESADGGCVLCEIMGNGSLQSARIIAA